MVSSTLLKLLRKSQSQSAVKIFARSHKPLLTQIQIPSLTESGHLQKAADSSRSIPSGFTHVYPTFSFGYLLNPISPPPLMLIPSEEQEDTTTSDDSRTIRADSVKKKRKKKMNKHKLRKLRKRLQRKTKT